MSTCRSCRARVLWVVTDGGKRMPVDADPVPDGTLVIADRGADDTPHVTSVAPDALLIDDPPRYRSHFATCPNADQHRRRTTS